MDRNPSEPKPAADNRVVRVVYHNGEIIIGGRVLQEDQDPLDLMELYFSEGAPHA
jgi:hypothetical protein